MVLEAPLRCKTIREDRLDRSSAALTAASLGITISVRFYPQRTERRTTAVTGTIVSVYEAPGSVEAVRLILREIVR